MANNRNEGDDEDDRSDEFNPNEIAIIREKTREREEALRAQRMIPRHELSSDNGSSKTPQTPPQPSPYNEAMGAYWEKTFDEDKTTKKEPKVAKNGYVRNVKDSDLSIKRTSSSTKRSPGAATSTSRAITEKTQTTRSRSGSKSPTRRTTSKKSSSPDDGTKTYRQSRKPPQFEHEDGNSTHAGATPTDLERSSDLPRAPGAFSIEGPGMSREEGGADSLDLNGDNETANVTEAVMIDGEKVYSAESTDKDHFRRNMLLLACLCLLIIVSVVVALVLTVGKKSSGPIDPCDLALTEQSLVQRCNCTGTTGNFFDSLSTVGQAAYQQQQDFLATNEIAFGNATADINSCDRQNLNLLVAANITNSSEQGLEFWNLTSTEFQTTVHVLIDMYVSMGGLDWLNDDDWLSDEVCSWFGLTCVFSNIIETLSMPENNIQGTIPTQVGLMQGLREFEVRDNEGITGVIPTELGRMTKLLGVSLRDLQLTGTIPSEIANLQRVDTIDFTDNELSGPIPASIFSELPLRDFRVGSNQLQGSIPTSIGSASSLIELELGGNALTGTLPTEMAQLTMLEILSLSNNQFSGNLPSFLGELPFLSLLFIQSSGVEGIIPSSFCTNTTRIMTVIVDCPSETYLPECDCCSRDDRDAEVVIVCSVDVQD